jgi:class 3 adenylate cyclase
MRPTSSPPSTAESLAPLPGLPRRRLSLRVGLSTAFVLMVLGTASILCTILFVQMRGIMRQDIRERIGDIAGLAALTLDGDLHAQVTGPADENTDAFRTLKARLQAVKASAPDLRFAYTIKRTRPDAFAFWIDAETDASGTKVGDPVTTVTALVKDAFERPRRQMVEPEFYSDEWGTWQSAYSPIYARDGRLEAIVGVDISAAKIAASERAALMVLFIVAVLITVPVALLGLLLSSRIVRPLNELEEAMARVRELNLDQNVVLESRFREIVRMRDAVNAMKSGLRSFSKYVPTELVRELIREGNEATLGGRRAELTIFFSDIEGFTTLAEATTPEGLAADLADYFALMTGTILEAGGTVDKYIGDAVMAFWGAPSPRPDHAVSAVRTALLLRRKLDALNVDRVREGRPPINTRIGLATGEVIVGNFGYENRLNYTVMGDTVNLASRLEGLNKYVGTAALTNEATARATADTVVSRLLGTVAVKGKKEGVRIYEPLAAGADAVPLAPRVEAWNAAVERYLARDFEAALPTFEAWLAVEPDDEPAARLADQCRAFVAEPPGPEWTGTVIMDAK